MSENQKEVTINDYNIIIYRFKVFEALNVRKNLMENFKNLTGNIELDNNMSILESAANLLYCFPTQEYLKLFKNCAAKGLGGLDNEENFNAVFAGYLDGPSELALEIILFNGFFSLKTISTMTKKIPGMEKIGEDMTKAFQNIKI